MLQADAQTQPFADLYQKPVASLPYDNELDLKYKSKSNSNKVKPLGSSWDTTLPTALESARVRVAV